MAAEYRHMKRKGRCKGCNKVLDTEKNDGEKAICFYVSTGSGVFVHICKDCVLRFLELMAEEESPEVVED